MHEATSEYAISTRTPDCIGLHEDAMEQIETQKNTAMAGCVFNPGRSPSLQCVLESDLGIWPPFRWLPSVSTAIPSVFSHGNRWLAHAELPTSRFAAAGC